MKSKTLNVLKQAYILLEQDIPDDLELEQEPDIAQPDPDAAQEQGTPAPLTSKGEEFLLKMAYLSLLYTPKDDEMMQIKETFEASGIHDENDIQAEAPESIRSVKSIITNILGTNDTTAVANELQQIPQQA